MPFARLTGRALIFLLAGVVLTGSTHAMAADAAPAEARPAARRPNVDRPGPAAMLERIKADLKALDLSDEQKATIKDLFAKTESELADLRRDVADGKPTAELRERARTTMQALRQKVGGVLNDEQRQALRRRLAQAGAGAAEAGGMVGERIRAAMKSIELTDEQKQKLDALLSESQSKASAINDQTRAKLRELMQETRGQIDALLTPEQRERFKQALPEGGPPPRGDARNPDGGGPADRRPRPEPAPDRL